MALLLLVVSVTGLFGMNHTNQSIKTLYQGSADRVRLPG
nr:hypothetical protein PJ912_00965 [Pectobacterium colocasium]